MRNEERWPYSSQAITFSSNIKEHVLTEDPAVSIKNSSRNFTGYPSFWVWKDNVLFLCGIWRLLRPVWIYLTRQTENLKLIVVKLQRIPDWSTFKTVYNSRSNKKNAFNFHSNFKALNLPYFCVSAASYNKLKAHGVDVSSMCVRSNLIQAPLLLQHYVLLANKKVCTCLKIV